MAINRKYGPADALDTVQLASQLKTKANGIVVGIDLSGDPRVSVAKDEIGTLYTCVVPFNGIYVSFL